MSQTITPDQVYETIARTAGNGVTAWMVANAHQGNQTAIMALQHKSMASIVFTFLREAEASGALERPLAER